MKKALPFIIAAILIIGLLACLLLAFKPVRESIFYRAEQLYIKVFYTLFPPENKVFTPGATPVDRTSFPTYTPAPTSTATTVPETPYPTQTPTLEPTPVPSSARLTGIRYQTQHGYWNYCAPANLFMELSYWGWDGDVVDIGTYVKPYELDKNVMPYELADYVTERTNLSVVVRYGGTLELLKRLIANGYPVLIEKGTYIQETTTGKVSWMGHYNVLSAYDDALQQFLAQDSYYTPDYPVPYELLEQEWRSFNYVFLVVYPPDQQDKLFSVLGTYADSISSDEISARIASNETVSLTGTDQYFAWFNRGSSLVRLQDFYGAAQAYDQAFQLYAALSSESRPWRITWYQTGPYFAYYYSGRYQDVIDLATTTISAASQPFIEESWYWRSMAESALGDTGKAEDDLCKSLEYHPGFQPALDQAQALGVTCP